MGKLILVTGGARSGKSSFALRYASRIRKPKIFIATCIPRDAEMRQRVARHRRSRSPAYRTVEAGSGLVAVLARATGKEAVLLVDCLTLFVSALLVEGRGPAFIQRSVRDCIRLALRGKATVIFVTNEVGMGIVPENALARLFRDLAGFANQEMARNAHEVYCLLSGVPLCLKGERKCAGLPR